MENKLENIGKENPFDVPEGYFDDLPMAIQQKIQEKKGFHLITGWILAIRWQYKVALAAAITIITVGVIFIIQDHKGQEGIYSLNVVWEDLIDETNIMVIDFDESMLIETLIAEANGVDNEPIFYEELEEIPVDDIIDWLVAENYSEDLVYDL